ncbi:MAG TPA: hypothetical protein VER17_16685 [Tepidisphaeraceae bacterium]|nr:hypothetical protein [Tepidisphaeraceae bacterium]
MVQFSKPELEQFLDEQVRAGRFPSRDAAVEAAVQRMMLEESELDEELLDPIDRAEEQIARGEGPDWKEASAKLRREFLDQ